MSLEVCWQNLKTYIIYSSFVPDSAEDVYEEYSNTNDWSYDYADWSDEELDETRDGDDYDNIQHGSDLETAELEVDGFKEFWQMI